MRNKKLYEYEWISNIDGTFWSLHEKTARAKVPVLGTQGYIGYVGKQFFDKCYHSGRPGLKNEKNHSSMRDAAKRVESWVK